MRSSGCPAAPIENRQSRRLAGLVLRKDMLRIPVSLCIVRGGRQLAGDKLAGGMELKTTALAVPFSSYLSLARPIAGLRHIERRTGNVAYLVGERARDRTSGLEQW